MTPPLATMKSFSGASHRMSNSSTTESVGSVRQPAHSCKAGPDGLVSVYLMSETTIAVAAGGGSQEYLVAVSVGALRANGLGIIRTPESSGPGHCDITGRKTRGRLTRIVRQAQWLPGYAPPDGPD